MKKLVILLGAFALIGCGEKKATGDNGAAGNEQGAGDSVLSTNGTERPSTAGSSEGKPDAVVSEDTEVIKSQLLGFWAMDPAKIVKDIEENPPEEISENQLKVMKQMLLEPSEDKEEQDTMMLQFAEGEIFSLYQSHGILIGSYFIKSEAESAEELEIEIKITELSATTYQLDLIGLTKEEAEGKIRSMLESENKRMPKLLLAGETMRFSFPKGEGSPGFPVLLSRMDEAQVSKRKGLIKELFLHYFNKGQFSVGERDEQELQRFRDQFMEELGFSEKE